MGAIISVVCSCGYVPTIRIDDTGWLITDGYHDMGELLLGHGMYTRSVYYYPALCNRCQEVVPVNLERSPIRCPICKGMNIMLYYEPQMIQGTGKIKIPYSTVCIESECGKEAEYSLYEDALYLCPKCKSYRLKFKQEGLWD